MDQWFGICVCDNAAEDCGVVGGITRHAGRAAGSIPFAAPVLIVLVVVFRLLFGSCLALLLLFCRRILHRLALLHGRCVALLHFPAFLRHDGARLRLLDFLLWNIARLNFTAFWLRHAALLRLWGNTTLLDRRGFASCGLLTLHGFALLDRAPRGLIDDPIARAILAIALNRFGIRTDRGRPALLGRTDRARRCVTFNGRARRRAGCGLIAVDPLGRLR